MDVDQTFQLFKLVIYNAPEYNVERLVGRPINAVIATSMQRSAGRAIFNDKEVNAYIILIKMFDVWIVCLTSTTSQPVLNQGDGWLCPKSLQKLTIPQHDGQKPDLKFTAAYVIPRTNITASSVGIISSSELKDDTVRPLPGLKTDNTFITCACESHLYRVTGDVKLDDKFWIKDQAYSLRQMLNDDVESANKFVGGTVFQTYLSPCDYHR